MLETPPPGADDDRERVNEIVTAGPRGAIAIAGVATALVVAMWLAFYLLVFMPRATP